MTIFRSLVLALCLAACAGETAVDVQDPADAFMAALRAHCGEAYEGKVVSADAVDADFAKERLVMHVRSCAEDEIRIPFHVGEDRSRTWVLTRTDDGLRLKHDHRHEDGSEDAVTQYGGYSRDITSAYIVEFPVDAYSIDMFNR